MKCEATRRNAKYVTASGKFQKPCTCQAHTQPGQIFTVTICEKCLEQRKISVFITCIRKMFIVCCSSFVPRSSSHRSQLHSPHNVWVYQRPPSSNHCYGPPVRQAKTSSQLHVIISRHPTALCKLLSSKQFVRFLPLRVISYLLIHPILVCYQIALLSRCLGVVRCLP